MKLLSTEQKLVGHWVYKNNSVSKDEVSERIEWLINNQLIKITTSAGGWDILYKDPEDNRLWELVYLNSEMSGGGPPTLINLTEAEAKKKYTFNLPS